MDTNRLAVWLDDEGLPGKGESIDHRYLGQSLPIPLLSRLKLIVKHDDIGPQVMGLSCYLLRFT